MVINRILFVVLGALVMLSAALAYTRDISWLWLTVFLGLHQVQMGFTGFCPLAKLLKALGLDADSPCWNPGGGE